MAASPASLDFSRRVDRAAYIDRRLAELYPRTPVPLDHTDPYTLLIAVLLSAPFTDKRVNPTTAAFFRPPSTPAQMVQLSVAGLESIVPLAGLAARKSGDERGLP